MLLCHSSNAMRKMFPECDMFPEEFDIKFNSNKSVAIPLQLAGSDLKFVSTVKYLGISLIAAKLFKCSIDHTRL